jgi:hypothetical protein
MYLWFCRSFEFKFFGGEGYGYQSFLMDLKKVFFLNTIHLNKLGVEMSSSGRSSIFSLDRDPVTLVDRLFLLSLIFLFKRHAEHDVDLPEMHHPQELLSTAGDVLALLQCHVCRHVNVLVLARIAKALVQVQQNSRSHHLEKKSGGCIQNTP